MEIKIAKYLLIANAELPTFSGVSCNLFGYLQQRNPYCHEALLRRREYQIGLVNFPGADSQSGSNVINKEDSAALNDVNRLVR